MIKWRAFQAPPNANPEIKMVGFVESLLEDLLVTCYKVALYPSLF